MKCVEVYKELYHQEPFDVAFCPYRISPLGAHIDHQYLEIADATAKVVNTMTGEEQPVATENNLVLFSRELESKIQEQLDSASTYEEQYKAESANNITHGDIQYQISIKSESKFNVVCASFEKVRSNTVRTYNSISDGCVSVSYTPTPNEYDLKNQEIMLNSKDAALSMVYDIKTGKISLRGYIDEAELSRINLLPNFWNSKTVRFYDINYQLAQNEDKNTIFESWCDFLNYFDASIRFQLSFINHKSDMSEYNKVIQIEPQHDAFDDVRMEYEITKETMKLYRRKCP